jgi:hypothetical protein
VVVIVGILFEFNETLDFRILSMLLSDLSSL